MSASSDRKPDTSPSTAMSLLLPSRPLAPPQLTCRWLSSDNAGRPEAARTTLVPDLSTFRFGVEQRRNCVFYLFFHSHFARSWSFVGAYSVVLYVCGGPEPLFRLDLSFSCSPPGGSSMHTKYSFN